MESSVGTTPFHREVGDAAATLHTYSCIIHYTMIRPGDRPGLSYVISLCKTGKKAYERVLMERQKSNDGRIVPNMEVLCRDRKNAGKAE